MSHCLRSLDDIESCIRLFAASYVPGKQSILISIYTHWNKPETIREMTRLFCAAFPEAEIAGMTTAGGIDNGCMRPVRLSSPFSSLKRVTYTPPSMTFRKSPWASSGKKHEASAKGRKTSLRSFC